jgi:hypothetical protein
MMRLLICFSLAVVHLSRLDRFARDLAVQLAGHDMLKELGIR